MRKSRERASMKAPEGVETIMTKTVSTRVFKEEVAADLRAAVPAPAVVTRKVSAKVLAKVPLRTLKTICPAGVKGNVVRFILVPDFEVIYGAHGFRQLLPHLLDLRPALICIKATDVWKSKADDDFRDALQELPDNLSCWAVYDRLPDAEFQLANGNRGFADPGDGRMKTGIILVPELEDVDDRDDEPIDEIVVKSTKSARLAGACKNAHVNVPWVSPVFHESMAGYAFQKAGYAQMLEKDGKQYLAAMPHDYHQSEVIVVDAIGSGEQRRD